MGKNRFNGEFFCLLDNEKQIRADIWGSVQSVLIMTCFQGQRERASGACKASVSLCARFPRGLIS